MYKKLHFLYLLSLLSLTVTAQAPADFIVLSPNSPISWQGATNHTISWNVAGTQDIVPYVDILLSTDGGVTFTEHLALKIPNDGSEIILLPNTVGTANRIKVRKYNDDTFADVSDADFTITNANDTYMVTLAGENTITVCNGVPLTIAFEVEGLNGFSGTIGQQNTNYIFNSTLVDTSGILEATYENIKPVGIHPVTFTFQRVNYSGSAAQQKTITVYIEVIGSVPELSSFHPYDYETGVYTTPEMTWYSPTVVELYEIQIATDENFNNVIIDDVIPGNPWAQSTYTPTLNEETTYFWRVRATNGACTSDYYNAGRFKTGGNLCTDYASADVPVDINADVASAMSSILYIDSYNDMLSNFEVELDIVHSSIEDLTITLKNPDGLEAVLFDRSCTNSTGINAVFSNEGTAVSCIAGQPVTGIVLPIADLGIFDMEYTDGGNWTLEITDNVAGNGGILNSWKLNLCRFVTTLGQQEPVAVNNDVKLYPNPNNGIFTLQFTPVSNNIAIIIHDISGRQVYSKSYAVTNTFKNDITINGSQAGMYLVTIYDGDIKTTKKLILQ